MSGVDFGKLVADELTSTGYMRCLVYEGHGLCLPTDRDIDLSTFRCTLTKLLLRFHLKQYTAKTNHKGKGWGDGNEKKTREGRGM